MELISSRDPGYPNQLGAFWVISILQKNGLTTGSIIRHYPEGTPPVAREKFYLFPICGQQDLREIKGTFVMLSIATTQIISNLFLRLPEECQVNPQKRIMHAVEQSGLQKANPCCYADKTGNPRYFGRQENDKVQECT